MLDFGRHREDSLHNASTYRPGRSALRKGRVSIPNHAYFITKCVSRPNLSVLVRPECAQCLIDSYQWLMDEGIAHICGFVIMPDHHHAVVGLTEKRTLPQLAHSLHRTPAQKINKILNRQGHFWEDGYYDHLIRDRADFEGILGYMHFNPVKAGLLDSPEQWGYSTANPKFSRFIDWAWLGHRIV